MTGVAVPWGRIKFFDPTTGEPLVGGTVEHYVPGTLTQKPTWANQEQSALNPNPLTLDAAGEAGIWGDGLYRQILKRADGSTIWDLETGFLDTSGGGGTGNVSGPPSSSVGNFATWADTIGRTLADGGTPGALAFTTIAPITNGGTGATTAAGARTALGLAIGADVQAWNLMLDQFSGLAWGADKFAYATGASTMALATVTSFARSLLDDADQATALSTLGASPAAYQSAINAYTTNTVASLGDLGALVKMNVSTANTYTVAPQSSVAWPANARIDGMQYGAGQTTITPGAGVTIRSVGGKTKTNAQYSGWSLTRLAADEWWLVGDITT